MKVLILGAGRLGLSVASKLVKAGHSVVSVARFLNRSTQERLRCLEVATIALDLSAPNALMACQGEYDLIYHLVSIKLDAFLDRVATQRVNERLPGEIPQYFPGVPVVYGSSGNVYGYQTRVTESSAYRPIDFYGQTRVNGELNFSAAATKYQSPSVIFRIFYGNRAADPDWSAGYGLIHWAATELLKHQTVPVELGPRDRLGAEVNLIAHEDIIDFLVRGVDLVSLPPAIYNLAHPERIACDTLVTKVANLVGLSHYQFQGGDPQFTLSAEAKKLTQKLGPPAIAVDALIKRVTLAVKDQLGYPAT